MVRVTDSYADLLGSGTFDVTVVVQRLLVCPSKPCQGFSSDEQCEKAVAKAFCPIWTECCACFRVRPDFRLKQQTRESSNLDGIWDLWILVFGHTLDERMLEKINVNQDEWTMIDSLGAYPQKTWSATKMLPPQCSRRGVPIREQLLHWFRELQELGFAVSMAWVSYINYDQMGEIVQHQHQHFFKWYL